jgi:hypothetical protein
VRLAIATGGLLSIYLGYKLFCDVPFRKGRTFRTIFLLNLVSGAALAIFGIGVLTADLRGIHTSNSPGLRHQKSAEEGSFTGPKVDRSQTAAAQAT